ncbi:uncharacterized protein LOC126212829 [Schistocerca nitens]|uniref:uncharacterized protein LOC126212829 n=1 Tax=Schistocerca nitens TaxID=7011 RepID=UPI00211746F9|nr:uncharacterized protein LOC126212829 [Schistocerca nitens]XP_049796197.1 uncharacterized protein LOC126212829 [Schistocerca nitens]XP_049796198.1 uncharacterized protein LOC126212829 [Schistocerca nitens]
MPKKCCRNGRDGHPDRRCPSREALARITRPAARAGSSGARRGAAARAAADAAHEGAVLAAAAVQSAVCRAEERWIGQASVIRISHRYKFHPRRLSQHQPPAGRDFERRCRILPLCSAVPGTRHCDFPTCYPFTEEATLTNGSNVDLRNVHCWPAQSPRWPRHAQHRRPWSVNAWCGAIGNSTVSSHVIAGVLNKHPSPRTPLLLEDGPPDKSQRTWFRHDGCPARSSDRKQCCTTVACRSRLLISEGSAGRCSLSRSPSHTRLCAPSHPHSRLRRDIQSTLYLFIFLSNGDCKSAVDGKQFEHVVK